MIDGQSQYPCFNKVIDNPPPPLYRPTNVNINITTSPPKSFQGEQPTAWVSTCVENENDKSKYARLESCDSGIGEYPTTDIESLSQIPVTEEC